MPAICVFCASSDLVADRYVALATEVGQELARRGHSLVSGGGSVSCMGAVARAARAGGARTVGVIPRALLNLEVADTDCDELVVADDMRHRKGEMDRRADAFLALPGGLGTLEELLEVWVARTLDMHDKPIVVLDPDGVFEPLRAQVDRLLAGGFVRARSLDAVRWTDSVQAAFDALGAPPELPGPPSSAEVLEAEP
ncbi:MAG TPA: TIGR00730 family Rossman fold protein [Mycobacteriales bacterium]|nr:TIGR00730 family Rossman fold protein [Mycobacteriales bacterium]